MPNSTLGVRRVHNEWGRHDRSPPETHSYWRGRQEKSMHSSTGEVVLKKKTTKQKAIHRLPRKHRNLGVTQRERKTFKKRQALDESQRKGQVSPSRRGRGGETFWSEGIAWSKADKRNKRMCLTRAQKYLFIVTLFTMFQKIRNNKCPTGKRTNILWQNCINITEHYSAITRMN